MQQVPADISTPPAPNSDSDLPTPVPTSYDFDLWQSQRALGEIKVVWQGKGIKNVPEDAQKLFKELEFYFLINSKNKF